MRRALAFVLVFCLSNLSLLPAASTQSPGDSVPQNEDNSYEPFSPEQLDNILAPIALYPDPLLSQVLVAATFLDDVDQAARWVRANGTNGIDDQPWDVSVKAVAHYPAVISMMADKMDWTTSVGQAYVNQSTDVMTSVQRLRHMAHSVGNLFTTPQQQVLVEDDMISIVPYQPNYIYVPVYDPYICYHRRPAWGIALSFGTGFLIGAWLNRDCDWHNHRVYYHGWEGRGWIERSRPRIHITNMYVNNRYNTVVVNREIIHRNVDFHNMDRYNSVHRDVNFNNIHENNMRRDQRNNIRVDEHSSRPPVNNAIINRNIDTRNARIDQYRGHEGAPHSDRPPQDSRPASPPNFARPNPNPRPQPGSPHVFGRSEGNFDPRASSQRGQSSRQEMNQPRPAPRPSPQPRAQSNSAPPARAHNNPPPAAAPHGDRKKP
ncbi:MAG: DUF3300 domain-containing protein [Candidatus Acidiferrum sp.]